MEKFLLTALQAAMVYWDIFECIIHEPNHNSLE